MATLASFGSDASSAQAYYDSLPEEDKALLHGAWANLAPDDSAPPAPDGALAMAVTSSGCTTQWATQGFYSAGVEQLRFSTGLSWCWDGSYIYGVSSAGTRPDASFLGWAFDSVTSDYVENWEFATAYKFAQTHWDLCYVYCIDHADPWIAAYGQADYSFWWNSGGV